MQIRLSETIKRLLIIYVVVFVLQMLFDRFFGGGFRAWFALIPTEVLSGKIWQLATYSFLHADVMHLVLNCLVLAFLASDVEILWGTRKFLTFYFFCSMVAGLFYLLIQLVLWNPIYLGLPLVGASGGIYGILLAYGILFPDRQMLFMMLFPMKAKQFVWLLAGVEFLQAAFSPGQGGLGAIAHLSGLGAGYLFLWLQAKGFQFQKQSGKNTNKKKTSHLKLVKGDKPDDDKRDPRTWH
jgi:membrane associated rhomboid family serine protease